MNTLHQKVEQSRSLLADIQELTKKLNAFIADYAEMQQQRTELQKTSTQKESHD